MVSWLETEKLIATNPKIAHEGISQIAHVGTVVQTVLPRYL
jgi:hypothetical protein